MIGPLRCAMAGQVFGRRHDAVPGLVQRPRDQARICDVAKPYRDIKIVGDEIGERVAQSDGQSDLARMTFEEAREQRHDALDRIAERQADTQGSRRIGLPLAQRLFALLDLDERQAAGLVVDAPVLREPDRARRAQEQRDAQAILEPAHRLADRRRRRTQRLGGGREAERFCSLAEQLGGAQRGRARCPHVGSLPRIFQIARANRGLDRSVCASAAQVKFTCRAFPIGVLRIESKLRLHVPASPNLQARKASCPTPAHETNLPNRSTP